jgi:hypothetical protein
MSIQRVLKVFGLFILFISSMNSNIFPLVTSRIEGRVVEEDTGVPIEDALIYLIHNQKSYYSPTGFKFDVNKEWEKRTDKNGSYRFDNLLKGEYFICIYKEGYANIGPIRIQELTDFNPLRQKYPDASDLKPDTEGRIILEEGEVKHLKIEMPKEAIVEIKFTRKTSTGVEPLTDPPADFGAKLYLSGTDKEGLAPTIKETGRILFKNLFGGKKAKLEFWESGSLSKKSQDIQLEKGKTVLIENVTDFTSGTVLHGFIKDKNFTDSYNSVFIIDQHSLSFWAFTDKNGEYWIKGFSPGEIKVFIRTQSDIKEEFSITTKANQVNEFSKEY